MNEIVKGSHYMGYEYMAKMVPAHMASQYTDSYRCFGWELDENIPVVRHSDSVTLSLKRDHKLINHIELTRLQRNFEDCASQIAALERSKASAGTMLGLIVGVLSTAFIAGSTFAITVKPPLIWLCIVLAVPGFLGWGFAPFACSKARLYRSKQLSPLIEQKQAEVYTLCEKGSHLLRP